MTTERRLGQERIKAGQNVAADGDPKRVDLFRWVAWLAASRPRGRPITTAIAPVSTINAYDAHKERMRERSAELSRSGRDIGEMPAVVNPERKEACRLNLRLFCETYFPETFTLEWSADHLRVIREIEQAVLHGGLFAMAMPRGSGKTTLCEVACLWAALYGHRQFIMLIGASQDASVESLDNMKASIRDNAMLEQDFPEVCYPVQKLEGINQRASGQLYQGAQTRIGWTNDQVILPTIQGSPAAGVILRVAGITGRIRGAKFMRSDGRSVRPDLVLIDDPQTDESAKSPSQCATRERILSGAVLGLAGPGKKIAGLMTMTVVFADDLADRILDRKKHPQWQGDRSKLMYAFPTNEALWNQYGEIYRIGLENGRDLKAANAFYLANRAKMDEGAKPGWPARFNTDEHSAIQHAMNLRIERGEESFQAEYQNEPRRQDSGPKMDLAPDAIAVRVNGYKRGEVPPGVSSITAFADIQDAVLYWIVVGWEPDYTGHVLDYGTTPDQGRRYFSLRDVRKTMMMAYPGGTLQSAFYAAMNDLTLQLCGREWRKPDGTAMRLDRLLFDANYPKSQDPVYEFCRQSPYAAMLMPSRGRYVGAGSMPMNDFKRAVGERVGNNWRIPKAPTGRAIRHLVFDTNYWKTHVARSLAVPKGAGGGIWLYGSKAEEHRLLAEQLTAEYTVRTSGRGREVDEWKQRPDRPDNHWFDGLVGCAVAANVAGVKAYAAEAPKRKKIKLSQLFAR